MIRRRRRDLLTQIEQLQRSLTTEQNLVVTYRRLAKDWAERARRAGEEQRLLQDRALTAETLLAQLYRHADLGDPPRQLGRVDVHATTRALGMALAAARRAGRPRPPAAGVPANPAVAAGAARTEQIEMVQA